LVKQVTILETPHLAPYFGQRAALYMVIVCWWLFALTFWLRKRPPQVREAKRDRTSIAGLALQSAAYFIVWFSPLRGTTFVDRGSGAPLLEWARAVLTVAIAVASVWLVNAAARRLGKQWSLTARVVEGHALIRDGVYGFVRNPIYTGMLGMLLATGLATAQWIPLLVAIVLFVIGTLIRVRVEERLLREAFGCEFEKYVHDVPALIPGIY
jgi:protein-S-isoprenylcysteine O-methyltransferase Ste14